MNDSGTDLYSAGRRTTAVFWANGAGAVIAAGFAISALVAPGLLIDDPVTDLVRLCAGAYAVRAIPLAAVLIYLLVRRATPAALVPILVVSGVAQLGDAVIGLILGQPGMLFGGTLLAAIHLGTAYWLRRRH